MLTTSSANRFITASVWSLESVSEGHAQTFPSGMLPVPVTGCPLRVSAVTSTLTSTDFSTSRPPNFSGVLKGTDSKRTTASTIWMSVGLDILEKKVGRNGEIPKAHRDRSYRARKDGSRTTALFIRP